MKNDSRQQTGPGQAGCMSGRFSRHPADKALSLWHAVSSSALSSLMCSPAPQDQPATATSTTARLAALTTQCVHARRGSVSRAHSVEALGYETMVPAGFSKTNLRYTFWD